MKLSIFFLSLFFCLQYPLHAVDAYDPMLPLMRELYPDTRNDEHTFENQETLSTEEEIVQQVIRYVFNTRQGR